MVKLFTLYRFCCVAVYLILFLLAATIIVRKLLYHTFSSGKFSRVLYEPVSRLDCRFDVWDRLPRIEILLGIVSLLLLIPIAAFIILSPNIVASIQNKTLHCALTCIGIVLAVGCIRNSIRYKDVKRWDFWSRSNMVYFDLLVEDCAVYTCEPFENTRPPEKE